MMYLEQVPGTTPQQGLNISAKLIASIKILQYSAEELEASIAREVDQNPALEVDEQAQCGRCGTVLGGGGICPTCDAASPQQTEAALLRLQRSLSGSEEGEYRGQDLSGSGPDERDYDPLELVRTAASLPEVLLRQLGLLLPPSEQGIAEFLVGNLSSQGYLTVSVAEASAVLGVPEARVEAVLGVLHTLDPPGIGARDLRECLRLQLARFESPQPAAPSAPTRAVPAVSVPALARPLVEGYLAELGEHHFAEIAHSLGSSLSQVKAAWRFIQANLHPYPGHGFESDAVPGLGWEEGSGETRMLVRPDVVIRRTEGGDFEAEVVERRRYRLTLNALYLTLYQQGKTHPAPSSSSSASASSSASSSAAPSAGSCRSSAAGTPPVPLSEQERQHVRQYAARARFFMECVTQRWDTLFTISQALIAQQHAFLEQGVRGLRPLTRGELAASVGLHESTVSRATANKYVLLPSGRTVPFDDFFDGSLAAKEALREVIATEDGAKPYSDEELAKRLGEQGLPLARRTVAKYREALGILPSRFRI
jgi:RNA polymerase sigma-54 factor